MPEFATAFQVLSAAHLLPPKYFAHPLAKAIASPHSYRACFHDHYYTLLFGLLFPYLDAAFSDDEKYALQLDPPYFDLLRFLVHQQNADWRPDDVLSPLYSKYLTATNLQDAFKKTHVEFIRNLRDVPLTLPIKLGR